MGKIISIIGNLGAGKTTLARLLCELGSFSPYWESPSERPFSANFTDDHHRWALTNQIDFFLFRCQQEFTARKKNQIAIMDGGFDQDFHVFTRHIYNKGYLIPAEYCVCEGFYHFARSLLPAPDLIIRILVDIPTLLERRLSRGRKTIDQPFTAQELTSLETLIDDWLTGACSSPVIAFPFTQDVQDSREEIDSLILQINKLLLAV